MHRLHEIIQQNVSEWRAAGYPCDDYPAIAEILDYARLPDGETLRFLRRAQLRALETYWYLRLIEDTPHIFDLYRRYYPRPLDLLAALGLDREEIKDFVLNAGLETLWERIRTDDDFVKAHKLESVRETLTLDYPSYIFALAMGAGKTILIGAIVATEFALALEYHPDTAGPFVQNALAFAPGLTILESLRELAEVPYARILPACLYQPFEATYKLVFTRESNIYAYDFDQQYTDRFVAEVVRDFFGTYGDVTLPNGAPATSMPMQFEVDQWGTGRLFQVYGRDFPAGPVVLGGNHGAGYGGAG